MISDFFKPTQTAKSAGAKRKEAHADPSAKTDSSVADDVEATAISDQHDTAAPKRTKTLASTATASAATATASTSSSSTDPQAKHQADQENQDQDQDQDDQEEASKPVQKLTPKQQEIADLLQLEKRSMPPAWFKAFKGEMEKPYFLQIKRFLAQERASGAQVFPPDDLIYTFTKCPISAIKVVILGQDPYHAPGQAHGLCFSVSKGEQVPPSLVNIYRELESDLGSGFKRPNHGFLESWANQGVLLLNATLTVRKSQPNSHAKCGWQTFTDAIIAYINRTKRNVVFMLWGGFAQKKGKSIDGSKHLVLKATHPSPLGANGGGWFGSKHFSKANEYLVSKGLEPIDWNSCSLE